MVLVVIADKFAAMAPVAVERVVMVLAALLARYVTTATAVQHRTDADQQVARHFQTILRDARMRVSLISAMRTMSVTGNVVVVIGILVMTIFGMD